MVIGAGPGHGAGGSNDPQNQTADTTILDNVTKPKSIRGIFLSRRQEIDPSI
jgi:hypothetical protein